MKRSYILILLLSICSYSVCAQKRFFEKIAEMDGVTSIYISKAMFKMMPNSFKTEGVNIGDKVDKLDNLQVLTCQKAEVITKIRKEVRYVCPENGYEELMRVNSDNERVTICMKEKKGGKNEFVLLKDGKNEFVLLIITGSLKLKEIQEITGMSN